MVVLCGCSLNDFETNRYLALRLKGHAEPIGVAKILRLRCSFKKAMRDVCALDAIKVFLCTAGNG